MRGVQSIVGAERTRSPLMTQPRSTPQPDRPLWRGASRNTPAQADDGRGMSVIVIGTGRGRCHLREVTHILATSSLRDECMPAALGRRIAERTQARSQSRGVYRPAPAALGREQRS